MFLSKARTNWTQDQSDRFEKYLQAFTVQLGGTRVDALHAESRLPSDAWEALREKWLQCQPGCCLEDVFGASCGALSPLTFQNSPGESHVPTGREKVRFAQEEGPARVFRIVKNRSLRARRAMRDADDFNTRDQTRVSAEDESRDPDFSWAFLFSPVWCTWDHLTLGGHPPFASVEEANERLALDIDPSTIDGSSHLMLSYQINHGALLMPTLADAVRPGRLGTYTWHRYFHPAPPESPCGWTRPSQSGVPKLPEAVHHKDGAKAIQLT